VLDAHADATLTELRHSQNCIRVPRVAKAQPWAGISERLQRIKFRYFVASRSAGVSTSLRGASELTETWFASRVLPVAR